MGDKLIGCNKSISYDSFNNYFARICNFVIILDEFMILTKTTISNMSMYKMSCKSINIEMKKKKRALVKVIIVERRSLT